MTINWRNQANFDDTLYQSLEQLEAPLANDRLNGLMVNGNFTIGIGFDLVAGGRPVQNAVLATLGFKSSIVNLSSRPVSGVNDQAEYDFIQSIRTAVNNHNGASALNLIMAQRLAYANANASYSSYIGGLPRSTFTFANELEVRATFDNLWPNVYRQPILNKLPAINPNSREMIALASMTWNGGSGIIGRKLTAAINSGNRAEAWYEIRYGSNGGASASGGLAKRRYMESTLFGLYNTNVTSADAESVYKTLQKHRDTILSYEKTYGLAPDGTVGSNGNRISSANIDYSGVLQTFGVGVETLENILGLAKNTNNRGQTTVSYTKQSIIDALQANIHAVSRVGSNSQAYCAIEK
ncbi:MAG: hypothetical protein WBL28_10765 [Methylotenera sp.]